MKRPKRSSGSSELYPSVTRIGKLSRIDRFRDGYSPRSWLVLIATPGDVGFWTGAVIGEPWGLLRVVNSNERLYAGRVR
jgi:hypothetical protein